MLSIQHTCQPRQDILQGSFNPENFIASLSQVVDHYRGKPAVTRALYTDAEQFFRDATYATEGLRMVLTDVFSRLAGEHSAPALHRLETAFGGGKTHTLIALTHLGFRGRELAAVTQGIIDPQLLHAPGEVTVVGIAGDEIPVHQPQGSDLAPYTIWGELAYQIGGESLYRQVETAATSPAAPDRRFFEHLLEERKVVDKRTPTFQVEHDVSAPEHVPDKANRPVLALIALGSDEIDIERFVTTAGPNRPRLQRNLVFLLVPETVHIKGELWTEDRVIRAQEIRNHLEDLARTVLAMRQLKERPENHGITPTMLREQNFDTTLAEREHALVTTVSQTYDRVWFPSASGQLADWEIKTAGGEGGAPVIERIRETLTEAGGLITHDQATTHETLLSLSRLLFETSQTPTVASLREQFACQRRWPVLEEATLLESIVRAGVEQGYWCLFRMGSAEEVRPVRCRWTLTSTLPGGPW